MIELGKYGNYENIHIFATKYRKLSPKDNFSLLNSVDFIQKIQMEEYILMPYIEPETKKDVLIYLLSENSKYSKKITPLRRLLSIIQPSTTPEVYIVMDNNPSNNIRKIIGILPYIRFQFVQSIRFAIEYPKMTMCGITKILSSDEAKYLIEEDLKYCSLEDLPTIPVSDTQCLWIGAKVGDIVRVDDISDMTGRRIIYMLVIPSEGSDSSLSKVLSQIKIDTDQSSQGDETDVSSHEANETEDESNGETEEDQSEGNDLESQYKDDNGFISDVSSQDSYSKKVSKNDDISSYNDSYDNDDNKEWEDNDDDDDGGDNDDVDYNDDEDEDEDDKPKKSKKRNTKKK